MNKAVIKSVTPNKYAKILYKAGYRKVVPPKAEK